MRPAGSPPKAGRTHAFEVLARLRPKAGEDRARRPHCLTRTLPAAWAAVPRRTRSSRAGARGYGRQRSAGACAGETSSCQRCCARSERGSSVNHPLPASTTTRAPRTREGRVRNRRLGGRRPSAPPGQRHDRLHQIRCHRPPVAGFASKGKAVLDPPVRSTADTRRAEPGQPHLIPDILPGRAGRPGPAVMGAPVPDQAVPTASAAV